MLIATNDQQRKQQGMRTKGIIDSNVAFTLRHDLSHKILGLTLMYCEIVAALTVQPYFSVNKCIDFYIVTDFKVTHQKF